MPEEKSATAGGSSDRNLFGALCYIIGILVPLFILFTEKKKDRFLAFHAWQSLLITVIAMIVWFGLGAVTLVLSVVTMGFGGIVACLFLPLALVLLVVVLLLAYKAYQGQTYKLPVIGDFAEKQAGK